MFILVVEVLHRQRPWKFVTMFDALYYPYGDAHPSGWSATRDLSRFHVILRLDSFGPIFFALQSLARKSS